MVVSARRPRTTRAFPASARRAGKVRPAAPCSSGFAGFQEGVDQGGGSRGSGGPRVGASEPPPSLELNGWAAGPPAGGAPEAGLDLAFSALSFCTLLGPDLGQQVRKPRFLPGAGEAHSWVDGVQEALGGTG